MSPIAREMSEAQMADVAFYYSVLDAAFAPAPAVTPEVLAHGRRLAEDGLPAADVTACNLCHGADGAGDPPLFPYLAGQYAPYTALQLQLWQQDRRRNDGLDVMRNLAKALSAEDIAAVALYYETLRPGAQTHVSSGD
jgi:cytochrome c553